jgi:cytoskeleton protein RodZ
MSEDLNSDPSQDPERIESAPLQGAGMRLRAARERLNLSLEDVAVQIKTAPRKIAALEAERWDELPERPYLRGLIRNYARVLQLDPDPLLRAADDSLGSSRSVRDFNLTPTLHAPFPHRPAGPHESPVSKWMMLGVLVCAVVIGALLLPATAPVRQFMAMIEQRLHPDEGKAMVADNATPTVAEQARAASAGKPLNADIPANDAGSAPPPASSAPRLLSSMPPVQPVDSAASRTPQTPVASSPSSSSSSPALTSSTGLAGAATNASDPAALHMQFKDDSWVEVRQADGKLVSSQIFHSGTEQAIDASAPLQVVIGNAPAVNVSFRGKPIDLDPYTHARVARLSIP